MRCPKLVEGLAIASSAPYSQWRKAVKLFQQKLAARACCIWKWERCSHLELGIAWRRAWYAWRRRDAPATLLMLAPSKIPPSTPPLRDAPAGHTPSSPASSIRHAPSSLHQRFIAMRRRAGPDFDRGKKVRRHDSNNIPNAQGSTFLLGIFQCDCSLDFKSGHLETF